MDFSLLTASEVSQKRNGAVGNTKPPAMIQNQINFIRHYVEQQEDMEIYDTYMDDDISGTRFDRPAFERMMLDMRNGRIDCIVVKDLFRLGRDYIETANARKEERKQGKRRVVNFFKRKIFCGCCGSDMVIRTEKKYRCYICTRKRQYGKDSCNCLPVKMDMVYDTVFTAVKEQIKILLDTDALLRQMNQSSKAKEKMASFSEALNKCHADLQKVAALKSRLYADYRQ